MLENFYTGESSYKRTSMDLLEILNIGKLSYRTTSLVKKFHFGEVLYRKRLILETLGKHHGGKFS